MTLFFYLKDVAVATTHLRSLWPEIPAVFYDYPDFASRAPLCYLSFGVPIGFTCAQNKRELPLILMRLIEEIETRGIEKQGLYRTSGRVKVFITLNSLISRM